MTDQYETYEKGMGQGCLAGFAAGFLAALIFMGLAIFVGWMLFGGKA